MPSMKSIAILIKYWESFGITPQHVYTCWDVFCCDFWILLGDVGVIVVGLLCVCVFAHDVSLRENVCAVSLLGHLWGISQSTAVVVPASGNSSSTDRGRHSGRDVPTPRP